MPYIDKHRREKLDRHFAPLTTGELNYVIHTKIGEYFWAGSTGDTFPGYAEINDVIGVLECVKLELYRRLASEYEDMKIDENGDIPFYQRWIGTMLGLRKPWDDVG